MSILCVCVAGKGVECIDAREGVREGERAVFDQKKKGAAAALTHDNFLNQTLTHNKLILQGRLGTTQTHSHTTLASPTSNEKGTPNQRLHTTTMAK